MKLVIKNRDGLVLLRPSKRSFKIVRESGRFEWCERVEKDAAARVYPHEVRIARGAHEVEWIENPFVPEGERWLVLKGSRIGAAESWFKRLFAATRGLSDGVELVIAPVKGMPAPGAAKEAA